MRSLLKRKYDKHSYECGEVFGRLTLTGASYLRSMYGQQRRIVEAVCVCGVVKDYLFELLIRGETRSCGCLRKDVTRKGSLTHGLSKHPLHDVWKAMKQRCYNSKNSHYEDYGGRGISICDEWRYDFKAFYDWALANGYEEGLSIDRIKNNGNYYPANCRFSTIAEQSRNKRRNKFFTAFGETKCLFDWAKDKRCKVGVWTLRGRYDSGKWTDMEEMMTAQSVDRKISQRKMKSNTMITAFGETKCMAAWLEDSRCVIKVWGLMERIKRGWDGQKAITTPSPSNKIKSVIRPARNLKLVANFQT